MPIEHINKTDTLNEGREKINEAIDGANAADITSKEADTKATQALANSESTQTQLDTIVIDGDSSVEAAQARVDEKGVPHTTLKDRIDDGMNSVNQQLADKADTKTTKIVEELDFKYAFSMHFDELGIDFDLENFEPRAAQSMVIVGDSMYLTISQNPSTQRKGMIVEVDRYTLKYRRHLIANIYHSNGMAYCPNYIGKEVLVIAHLWDDTNNKSGKITIIDIESFKAVETIDLNHSVRSISYDIKNDVFVTVSDNTRHVYNTNFDLIRTLDNMFLDGSSQANIAVDGINIVPFTSNVLSFEDYDGNTLSLQKINYDAYGELEAIYPINDGEFIAMFLVAPHPIEIKFFKVDLFKTKSNIIGTVKAERPTELLGTTMVDTKRVYVDSVYEGEQKGTSQKPYKKINDAINSLYNIGNYVVVIKEGVYEEVATVKGFRGSLTLQGENVELLSLSVTDVEGVFDIRGSITIYGAEKSVGSSSNNGVMFNRVKSFYIPQNLKIIGSGDYGMRVYSSSGYVSAGIEIKGYDTSIGGEGNTYVNMRGAGVFGGYNDIIRSIYGSVFHLDRAMEQSVNTDVTVNGGKILRHSQSTTEQRNGVIRFEGLSGGDVVSKKILFDFPMKSVTSVLLSVNTPATTDKAHVGYTASGLGGSGFEAHASRSDGESSLTVSWLAIGKI